MKIVEIDGLTDTKIEREATAAEIAQREADQAVVLEAKAKEEAEKTAAEAKRNEALSKLAVLGLTEDDLKALGL